MARTKSIIDCFVGDRQQNFDISGIGSFKQGTYYTSSLVLLDESNNALISGKMIEDPGVMGVTLTPTRDVIAENFVGDAAYLTNVTDVAGGVFLGTDTDSTIRSFNIDYSGYLIDKLNTNYLYIADENISDPEVISSDALVRYTGATEQYNAYSKKVTYSLASGVTSYTYYIIFSNLVDASGVTNTSTSSGSIGMVLPYNVTITNIDIETPITISSVTDNRVGWYIDTITRITSKVTVGSYSSYQGYAVKVKRNYSSTGSSTVQCALYVQYLV